MKIKLREREVTISCEKTIWNGRENVKFIYSKMMIIRRVKIKEDKMIEKE